jgi:trk system potassium uptake protein TrkA
VILPKGDDLLEAGDEMLFVAESDVEDRIRAMVHGQPPPSGPR